MELIWMQYLSDTKGVLSLVYDFTDMIWEKTNTFNGSDRGRPFVKCKRKKLEK